MQTLLMQNTPIFIALAFILVGLLAWRFKRDQFHQLSWQFVGLGAAIFWSIFAALMYWYAWNFYYHYYAPSWARYGAPLVAIIFYFMLALLLRWVALRLPGNPTVTFCLLGGLESVPEHFIAIYRFHILQIPLLKDTSPAGIFIFAFFEYVVYWSLALSVTIALDLIYRKYKKRRSRPGTAQL